MDLPDAGLARRAALCEERACVIADAQELSARLAKEEAAHRKAASIQRAAAEENEVRAAQLARERVALGVETDRIVRLIDAELQFQHPVVELTLGARGAPARAPRPV